ncbi:LysM peptidoglycan-binding domain-containing M23 family metallopeptidase [Atopococcus tabaci]|uniref:LysM peptidoglycan-binding domain-containing M23 family metallopeptidase n=1 Tax=Atopococcus tabaci TaxID=269774 RepID=UPI00146FA52A|nr:LysM peptidoglycan-binding domain-containing M23 family metallopeptidase [Atopococcus tabaci]
MNKKWVAAAATAALIGAGGVIPFAGPTTVHAAEESSVPAWSANSVEEVAQELEIQNAEQTLSYQIQWGDTLSALSAATGVSVAEIAAQNNIENPDLIYANEYLYGSSAVNQEVEETPVEQTEAVEAAEQTEEAAEPEEPVETDEAEEVTEEEEVDESALPAPGETVEPMEMTEETPVAEIVLPEDPEEEVVEEVLPEPEELEEVEVQEVTTTDEMVDPNDQIVTEQLVAVVTEPESHKEPSEAFIMPAQGRLTSGYGYRNHPISSIRRLHAGIDIAGGGPVSAVQSGTVVAAQYDSGWGNYVKIDHGNGLQTLYAHLQDGSTQVSVGDQVSQGQTIGTMGRTGSATGVHLHFEVYVNGIQVDPAPYLPNV